MVNQPTDQASDKLWVTQVQVATVWTEPVSAREIDKHGTNNPTDIDKWIESQSYENKLALCDENRVQTQLLYGEQVIVTEIDNNWAKVIIPTQASNKDDRGYPGWVPVTQLKQVNKEDWKSEKTAAVTTDFAWLETESGEKFLKVSYMTLLPVQAENNDRIVVMTLDGPLFLPKSYVTVFKTNAGLEKKDGQAIVKAGERYLGIEYFWGGMSAFGYDCSGFSYNMHKACGYEIPRDAGDQAVAGVAVAYDQLLPGDLLFFANLDGERKGKVRHVGIYYGDGKLLHSPSTGKKIEIITLKGTKYEQELCAARRFWQEAGEK